jgi:tripartite ATP-independent transporter DctM subunit
MACALFAAVSGSSPATVVAIGSIILPAMVKQGFPPRFGAGVITTSGALGILIPPSIVMVMYAVATNTSVGALFIAGIVPGLVLATFLGTTTWWLARKNNCWRRRLENAGGFRGHLEAPARDRGHRRNLRIFTPKAAVSAVTRFSSPSTSARDMTLRGCKMLLVRPT